MKNRGYGSKVVHVSKFEMRGFKSFGHKKVSLPLSSGLTAIVGPNGSGKSNVVDALSFALGQMSSKTLRTSKFAELIYHGEEDEDGKKPAPFAKVIIHFKNDDGALPIDSEEVKISRKVNHDGQSTYKLNGKRSSRQEIMELISEEILGSGGHNFVMQGDVDQLIEMSSTERREIIDDLAGVAEFDEKKSKALSELEEVDTNLQSQEGALEELKDRIEKLDEERKDALKYQELSSELKEKKAKLTFLQVKNYQEKIEGIQDKIENKDQKIEKLEGKKEKIEEKKSDLKDKLEEEKELLREKEESEAVSIAERISSKVQTLKEQLKEEENGLEALKDDISEMEEE
ncbi:MAG: AAA family ATPase, partial [Hadesarchaea archaeon]|nr:AAA family ATPase [Hadesarchaea archaeon]